MITWLKIIGRDYHPGLLCFDRVTYLDCILSVVDILHDWYSPAKRHQGLPIHHQGQKTLFSCLLFSWCSPV